MGYSIKKAYKSLAQWFGQFRQDFYPTHQKLSNADGLADICFQKEDFSPIRELPLLLTGLGVCQGEAIVIRSTGIGKPCQNLVIDKLQYRFLDCIHADTVKRLHCLAHRLEYQIQSCQQMQDSQKQATIKLDDCPFLHRHNVPFVEPFEGAICNDAIQPKQEQPLRESQLIPLCQEPNLKCSCPLLYHKDKIQDSPK